MKAITICQPYAHLICVTKTKGVENRTWPTRHRGPLLIHAGKSRKWLNTLDGVDIDLTYGIKLADMSFGAVVGAATLADCIHIDHIQSKAVAERFPWLQDHEHASGPWCWVLVNRVMFPQPVAWKGAQGLFDIPEDAVAEQVAAVRAARAAA
ncbi:MAG TPA: hypothetical protein VGE22_06635 [Solimonas sp.]